MKKRTCSIHFRTTDEVREYLEKEADKKDATISAVINWIVMESLQKKGTK